MKNAISTLLQFLFFFLVFAAGSFARPFKLQTTLDHSATLTGTRFFIWDGLVLMLGVYVALLLIHALRKRLTTSAPWTTLAVLLAAIAGFALKLGFVTQDF